MVRAGQSGAPIGELFAADGNAQLVQPAGAGMSVVPGSELSAGVAPARLRLYRGGQVRICPRSSMSVNSGHSGLMFAMGAAAIEIDYTLAQRGSDFLITPDFSLQLAGPGKYHFALASNKQGDTCVKSLAGNSAAIQVSELLSAATYRIRPQESVSFHAGRLQGETALNAEEPCGCPEAAHPVMRAASEPPISTKERTNGQQAPVQTEPVPETSAHNDGTAPLPEDHAGQVHVEVDTPFVFSARNAAGVKPYSVARLSLSSLPNVFFVQEMVDPVVLAEKPAVVSVREQPAASVAATAEKKQPEKKEKKGFFGKLKGLFSGIFHR